MASHDVGPLHAAEFFLTATLHDTNEQPDPIYVDGVFVGGAGDLVAVDHNDNEETFTLPAGAILPIKPKILKSTGTTATNIILLMRK